MMGDMIATMSRDPNIWMLLAWFWVSVLWLLGIALRRP